MKVMARKNNSYREYISQSDISNKTLVTEDGWTEKIWTWADEFELKESEVPRDKQSLLALEKLEILELELDEQHSRDVYRMGYIPDELNNLTNLVEINISGLSSGYLPKNIGQLSNLTKLCIRHSKLRALPDSIGQLTI